MKLSVPSPAPELVQNAYRIEQIKARKSDITKRQAVLDTESEKLDEEDTALTTELAKLVRRNDELSRA